MQPEDERLEIVDDPFVSTEAISDRPKSRAFSNIAFLDQSWLGFSWQKHKLSQMPFYSEQDSLEKTERILRYLPGVVSYNGVQRLKERLAYIHENEGFVLQIGDCAEVFNQSSRHHIFQKMSLFSELHSILNKVYPSKVVSMGRMAGQFAKPRSAMKETINGREVINYFGDIVNGVNVEDRDPNPERMIIGHATSCETVNNIKLFCHSLTNFYKSFDYAEDFFTCHESYLLPYEQNLLRLKNQEGFFSAESDPREVYHTYTASDADLECKKDIPYDSSAHFLWIGERTRNIDHGHMAFIKHIDNPVGVKIGASVTADEIEDIIDLCNPCGEFGKLSLIFRFGKVHMPAFEKIVKEIIARKLQHHFLWICDPMHGNTYQADSGYKTRAVEDIEAEIKIFFNILNKNSIPVSGIHLEASPMTVYECCSQSDSAYAVNGLTYFSACDPRLNQNQSLQLILTVAELLKKQKSALYNCQKQTI